MRHIYRWADHVIALSEETRRDLIAAFALDPKEVSVVPNAIDPAVFRPVENRDAVRSGLGLDTKEFLAGSVASLHPTKNHRATIGAMALLAKRGAVPPKFLLFGEGQDRPDLEKAIRQHHLGEHLILAGRKRPVAPWLQSLDLFVLASHWEGQPLALLQALDCQIPILASRIEGNTALLTDKHPGLFEPTDHASYADLLERAISDKDFRLSLLDFKQKLPRPSLPTLSLQLAELYGRLAAKV
jgi:glycosyltransferase involved in cell wall biosynthesis